MPIFKPGPGPYALPLAMTGVRMGERLLVVGAGDPKLFAKLAAKVGLSGRAAAVVASDRDADVLRAAAAGAGVLVEVSAVPSGPFPYEGEAFDLAVVDATRGLVAAMPPADRAATFTDVRRVVRRGGRAIVIERVGGGLRSIFRPAPPMPAEYRDARGALGALERAGFRPVRLLAERSGWRFTEGLNPAPR